MGSKNKRLVLAVILIFLTSLVMVCFPSIEAQSVGNIVVKADGTVMGTDTINQSGNTYTLTTNISGNIQIQRSNIVIDGAGYSLNQGGIDLTNGVGQNPANPTIGNVTVENFYIESGGSKVTWRWK